MSKKHLVLKCLAPDFTAYGGFRWPSEVGAKVVAPDWQPTEECGKGLHGWLNGEGDSSVADHFHTSDAKWLVLEVPSFVELSGKVKFKSAKILHVGSRGECARYIWERTKAPRILGLELIGGYRSTLTGGDDSTLTGGSYSTLTGGDRSTLTGGDRSTLTGGDDSTLTGGDRSTLTGGSYSTLTGGDGSELRIRYYDSRWRTAIAYVGENGIEAGVAYKLNDNHEFVRAN